MTEPTNHFYPAFRDPSDIYTRMLITQTVFCLSLQWTDWRRLSSVLWPTCCSTRERSPSWITWTTTERSWDTIASRERSASVVITGVRRGRRFGGWERYIESIQSIGSLSKTGWITKGYLDCTKWLRKVKANAKKNKHGLKWRVCKRQINRWKRVDKTPDFGGMVRNF